MLRLPQRVARGNDSRVLQEIRMSALGKPGPYGFWIALAMAASLTACNDDTATSGAGKPPANRYSMRPTVASLDVTRVDMGTAVGPDGSVHNPSITFKPTDTVYVAVTTQRFGRDIALKARWTYQDGTVVKEITKTISPTDTLVTDFQISNDAGWPAGRYKVEIFVGDQKTAVTEYTVVP
jgi:hypothetical protein